MELIILGGIAVVVLLFNAALLLFFPRGPWDREAQGMARSMWLGIVAVGGAISVVWFGLPALLAIWPFWLLFAGASALFFAVGEWRARKHDARQTLAERMTELRAQGPLPTWAAGIEARQASSVVERRNAPQKRGLLARLDDWMGL